MAGHSKWANIKHRKNRQDVVKGKIFSKLIRAITVSARSGADLSSNSKLRLIVDKALSYNMAMDTIERAISRGAGTDDSVIMEEVVYEGYAEGGIAILIECLTDNRNRTAGEIRHIFSKYGGNLGIPGSVAYLFRQCGVLYFSSDDKEEERITLIAINNGAEDVIVDDDLSIKIITPKENFMMVKEAFEQEKIKPDNAEISMLAIAQISPSEELNAKITAFIEALDTLDDVQNVYSNMS